MNGAVALHPIAHCHMLCTWQGSSDATHDVWVIIMRFLGITGWVVKRIVGR